MLMVAALAISIAVVSCFLDAPRKQLRDVQRLKRLANQSNDTLFSVTIWYGNDLRWNENRRRHELAFTEPTGSKNWISDWLGRDFAFSPISIEIDCDEFDSSTLTQELVDQIRKLDSIEQVWVEEFSNDQGQARLSTTDTLRKLFPDLIIASPQPEPCHDQLLPAAG